MINLVVLNYNDFETTFHFISLIKEYNIIDKIIVTDNCSTDDSFEKLCELRSDKIDVIATPENKGYASGNNYGVRYALKKYAPDYVIISNPDVEFSETMIEKLYEKAKMIDNLGIIASKMNCLSGITLELAWRQPGYLDYLLDYVYPIGKIRKKARAYQLDNMQEELIQVDVVPGSFLMFASKAYKDVDGFDERTFLYCEEDIISAKLKEKGYQNYMLTTEEYIHRHSVSINKSVSSVKKRLGIRQVSREVYCRFYLKTGKAKILLLRVFFYLWLCEYLLLTKIRNHRK